ncbi:MAG TPA: class I SAM-dependent methyltransferase [Planctomycetota bacterium]|nr:class I SAM-dependent methyltransferase [Planctomycetota bacterium]
MTTPAAVELVIVFPSLASDPIDSALFQVGRQLQQLEYRFTTVTPDTHATVNARAGDGFATDLRGVFGWNRPFHPTLLPDALLDPLRTAQALDDLDGGLLRTRVRWSSIGDRLFLHSAFPTRDRDAVFLGPDTYRFVHLLRRTLAGGGRLLELGAGTGAAALCLADRYEHLVMTDINPLAVRYARINATLAGCDHADVQCVDLAARVEAPFDAIIANPPYLIDPDHRLYRDGGNLGIAVALRMVAAALPLLAPEGCLVLYTGAPVVNGRDLLADALLPLIRSAGLPAHYDELEVDVFGSELASEVYTRARVERLAVVSVIVGRPHTARRAHLHPRSSDECTKDQS